jgi:adenine-specific DNA-methyltransferase
MKYMGHKGRILGPIREEVARISDGANALCDVFCGSGIVAWDLAAHFKKPILAADLQSFAAARAAAVLSRTAPVLDMTFLDDWFRRARTRVCDAVIRRRLPKLPNGQRDYGVTRERIIATRDYVAGRFARHLRDSGFEWPTTLAYAGYFFSLDQTLTLDALRATLPKEIPHRAIALGALIAAASRCAASPGHTAQPLGLKATSLPHVIEAWQRQVFEYVRSEANDISQRHALVEGQVSVTSWQETLDMLGPGDVVFCDPPYSGVQYSRFYHVLETLTRGRTIHVSGAGRNPPFEVRPVSQFSRTSRAKDEVDDLLKAAANRELRLIITFPVSRQSNGLAAFTFARKARKYFREVRQREVQSFFSSLGGKGMEGMRPARKVRVERIITCA